MNFCSILNVAVVTLFFGVIAQVNSFKFAQNLWGEDGQQQQLQGNHHPGGFHGQGGPQGMKNFMSMFQGNGGVGGGGGGWGWGKSLMGNFNFGNLGQNLMQQVQPYVSQIKNKMGALQTNLHLIQMHTPKTFYSECGRSMRKCYWTQKVNPMQAKLTEGEELESSAKPVLEQVCLLTKHICVGNTETCVSEGNCDVAMKITETTNEGKPAQSPHLHVTYLNSCKLDGQSVTDLALMPQMYLGIGFATYNEAGDMLECRKPKTSDFKLIFLWKNSTVAESPEPRVCKPANDSDFFAVSASPELVNSMHMWPKVCKSMDMSSEGAFNLKTFMTKYVPSAVSTPFFSPPFDFADKVEPQRSSNGMVITGSISE